MDQRKTNFVLNLLHWKPNFKIIYKEKLNSPSPSYQRIRDNVGKELRDQDRDNKRGKENFSTQAFFLSQRRFMEVPFIAVGDKVEGSRSILKTEDDRE
jgi:hypothetical protein